MESELGEGSVFSVELPRAVGRYQFTHALIQETLLEELSLTRRVCGFTPVSPKR